MAFRFNYPASIVDRFLNGECGSLALSLNNLTNWPIYAIYLLGPEEDITYSVPAHYVVRVSDDLFLDIVGLRTAEELGTELPATFDIPTEKVIIKLTDRTLGNLDYECSIEDMLFANLYAQDIVSKFTVT